jgi:hypothetical protein
VLLAGAILDFLFFPATTFPTSTASQQGRPRPSSGLLPLWHTKQPPPPPPPPPTITTSITTTTTTMMNNSKLYVIVGVSVAAAVAVGAAVANTALLWAQLLPAYNLPASRVANYVGVPFVLAAALVGLGPPAEGDDWGWRRLAWHALQTALLVWWVGGPTDTVVVTAWFYSWLITNTFHSTRLEEACADLPIWTWKQTLLYHIQQWVPCDWADARTLQTIAVACTVTGNASVLHVPFCVLLWNADVIGLGLWGWLCQPHLTGVESPTPPNSNAGGDHARPHVFTTSTGEEEHIID